MGYEDAATKAVSEGDATDWNAVYSEQLPRIYNYFRFRVAHRTEAEDLTAKTFEKAWKNRSRYQHDLAGISTWLFRIAQNVGTDYLRSRRPHLPLDAAMAAQADSTPESEVEHQADIARLVMLTATLPEPQRELIALKYGAAINNRAIAEITGLTESNVGTILSRTLQKLRSVW